MGGHGYWGWHHHHHTGNRIYYSSGRGRVGGGGGGCGGGCCKCGPCPCNPIIMVYIFGLVILTIIYLVLSSTTPKSSYHSSPPPPPFFLNVISSSLLLPPPSPFATIFSFLVLATIVIRYLSGGLTFPSHSSSRPPFFSMFSSPSFFSLSTFLFDCIQEQAHGVKLI